MEFNYECVIAGNESEERWIGRICPLMPFDCTEYEVTVRGNFFHLIIGQHHYSRYIYIPTWNIAMDISYLSDRFWNREQLRFRYPELSPEDNVSIVEALAAIEKHKD